MNPTYTRARDGALVTADEALDASGAIKSGYGFKSPLMMRDHSGQVTILDNGQDAYERRISDAWKGEAPPAPGTLITISDAIAARVQQRGISAAQAAYELRVSDAWRSRH